MIHYKIRFFAPEPVNLYVVNISIVNSFFSILITYYFQSDSVSIFEVERFNAVIMRFWTKINFLTLDVFL